MKDLILLLFLMVTLIGGALGVLVILSYMEDISMAYCIVALGVYAVIAFSAVAVAINRP